MGHNDYDVTANVYTHVNNDLKVAAASLQNEYLNNFLKAEKQPQKVDLTSKKHKITHKRKDSSWGNPFCCFHF